MLKQGIFTTFMLACSALVASPSAEGLQGFALRLLLKQVYFQEYLLVAAKPEHYQLSPEQLQFTWLGGYLALHRLQHDKAPLVDQQKRHLDQAKQFHVDQQMLERWQQQSTEALYSEFLEQKTGHIEVNPKTLLPLLGLDTKLNCQLPDSITKAMEAGSAKFTASGLWQEPQLKLRPHDLDCISFGFVASYQAVASGELDPQTWLEAMIKLREEPITRLLASWRAVHTQEYRASLDYLYPIVYQDASFRYAYEAVQRVYQFAERGKGAVALKRL